jgi:hypothetical protein
MKSLPAGGLTSQRFCAKHNERRRRKGRGFRFVNGLRSRKIRLRELINEGNYQKVSEGRSPRIPIRIDRLRRSGGEFAAQLQTMPETHKYGKVYFFNSLTEP